MVTDAAAAAADTTESGRVGRLLAEISDLLAEKNRLAALVKANNSRLDQLEGEAIEAMKMEGLDGCRAAGKSWYTYDFIGVSVPPENREKVIAAAKEAGLPKDVVTVNTSSLKAWLKERWEDGGKATESVAEGTAFAGLITEYRTVRLGHQTR